MVPYTNSSQGRNSYHSGKRDDHYRDNYRHRDDDKYRRNSDRYPIVDSHKRREYSSNIIYDGRSSPSSRPTHKDWSRKSPPNAKLNNLKNELGRFKVYKNADNFNIGDQVGEGTYGQVFKAKESQSNIHVALKKLYISEDDKGKEKNRDGFPITAIREIEILRSLKHPNIVELKAMISVAKENYGMDMYMVFEYMDHDLTGILNNSGVVFRVPHIKCLGKQLFKGLEYLHKQQIIHRDIKGIEN